MKIFCLTYGETYLSEKDAFLGGDKNKKIPITFSIYLVELEKRKILIDAGCDTMPGFEMKRFYSPAFVLRTIDVSPDEITDIIITHAHHDHIEAVKHFRNAVVHITDEEYLNGKKYIPDNMSVNVFKEKYIIDPQIKIIKWGGHSAGSAIVEIADKDITHVLAGDECYINDCIIRKTPTGSYCNLDKSCEFVEKYSDKNYRVYTCHDSSLRTKRML